MTHASEIAFLPDRLNGEPIVFRGLTSTELGLLAAGSVGFWLPLCLIGAGFAGYLMMGFGLAALLAVGTLWVASQWIQAVKRGKPDGYHVLRLELFLHDLKLRTSPFVRYSGVWDIRRSFKPRRHSRAGGTPHS